MKITRTLHVTTRKAWREWLKAHYKTEPEVWLVYSRKESGKPRIPYNDAVEEALCFGWIDSIVRRVDEKSFAQRFSPRRPKSRYSQANKVRLRSLIRQRKVRKEVIAVLKEVSLDDFDIPPDILRAIRGNVRAWKNFRNYTASYKEIRVSFINAARNRPVEFHKRLKHFIRMTENNRQFGFGGIERHYD
jgi:uncharacterized protein YdeI (YjbR/CyaY-like superfamily)